MICPEFKRKNYTQIVLVENQNIAIGSHVKGLTPNLPSTVEKLQIKLLPNNLKLTTQEKNDNSGIHYINKVSFSIENASEETLSLIKKWSQKKLACLLYASNSDVDVLGHEFEPMRMTYSIIRSNNDQNGDNIKVNITGEALNNYVKQN